MSSTMSVTTSPEVMFQEAVEAAAKAFDEVTPRPMVVSSGIQQYYISEGVCGFAYVKIRPATGAFVKYLKAQGLGHKAYGGGYEICSWELGGVGRGSQSYERAMAAARAAEKVLAGYGLNVFAYGRLD
jgi:hypothetical protein